MYRRHFKAVIGFHGSDLDVAKQVVCGQQALKPSDNEYDWLGPGVYFWENSPERAKAFAAEQMARQQQSGKPGKTPSRNLIKTAEVVGAVLDLGLCLDLTDQACLEEMRAGYERLRHTMGIAGLKLPVNEGVTAAGDKWNRKLDCAVINMVHEMRRKAGHQPYDTVRSPFYEGSKLFSGTEFTEKAHIQIAIRNPNCIKGTFWPRSEVRWPAPGRPKKAAAGSN